MNNNNSYYNEPVDFYIEKPNDWVFFPTQWALNVRNKAALSNDEISHIVQQASVPFVYMQKPLDRDDIAYPTVQATCRYLKTPTGAERERLSRLQIQMFEKSFRDFELIEHNLDKTISDCPANYFKVAFTVLNEAGDTFRCLSQSYNAFNGGLGFTIGLSGSPDNISEYKADLDQIVNSVLVGKSNA